MFEEKAQQYVLDGKLKEEQVNLTYIEDLLKEAVIDLDEAQKTQDIAHRATFLLAYMSMLRAGRALLLLKGYKPADSSQHKTVVEMTSLIMGTSYKTITDHFDLMRQKEDELIFEHRNFLSELDAHDAFHYALLLLREVVTIIKKEDPAFHVAM